MLVKFLFCLLLLISFSCHNQGAAPVKRQTDCKDSITTLNPYAAISDIPLPAGFSRVKADTNSFATWLRSIALKKNKTVYLYDGTPKINQTAQFAVLNIPVENKDLQQCADAVMRLRAEYLFANKKFNDIIFYDNEKGVYRFTAPYTKEHFYKYLDVVFGMCGSASLSKQLTAKNINNIAPGDVLIRGGFPGHAVIVMDVAMDKKGRKIYMLAQSYMPAQDIHLLKNPMDTALNPWYEVNENNIIETPEYTFTRNELKTW